MNLQIGFGLTFSQLNDMVEVRAAPHTVPMIVLKLT